MLTTFLYVSFAGLVGAGLGGLIGILFGNLSKKGTSNVLGFTAGLMLAIVFFDLMPESANIGGFWHVLSGVVIGVVSLLVINYFLEKKLKKISIDNDSVATNAINSLSTMIKKDSKLNAQERKSLLKTGLIMFIAIALHNLPEGLAIGTMGSVSLSAAFKLAVLICIHDIPEGIAITTPLVSGGVSKTKSFFISILAGVVTIIGGIIGIALGGISAGITAFALAFAGGAMLYVTILEIIPEMIMLKNTKTSQIMIIVGLLFGYLIISVM